MQNIKFGDLPELICEQLKWADRLVEILAQHLARQEFCIVPLKMHWWFRIGLPKMHGLFHMDLPKWYIQFRMVPPQVSHLICSHQISTVGQFWCTIAIMQQQQQNFLFKIQWVLWTYMECNAVVTCNCNLKTLR